MAAASLFLYPTAINVREPAMETTTIKEHQPKPFADNFVFPEALRWHQDRVWVSDVFGKKLYTVEPDGSRTVLCDVPHRPCGTGFLPDGTVVVVSMQDRKLMKLVDGGLALYADLSDLAAGDLNDLVVDERGRIYVGNFGFDYHGGAPAATTDIHVVEPDGSRQVAASGVEFPNAMVIINGGRTLVVAETWARRLTAFDRAADGKLSNARLFADLGHREPDGIGSDSADGIWVACFNTGEVVRVLDGGTVTDRVSCGRHAISCQLGGTDGRTLFCSAYTGTVADIEAGKPLGVVLTVEVETPGITRSLSTSETERQATLQAKVAVFGTLRFPPERVAQFLPHLKAMIDATRLHDECISYDAAEDVFEPGVIRISEMWPD